MKIVSWNCNGGFRNKVEKIRNVEVDILIVQECEDIANIHVDCYQKLWFGDDKNRGIGVFVFNEEYTIEELPRYDEFKFVIPLQVTGPSSFVLFAVWTKDTPKKKLSYIGQLYLALHHYYTLLEEDVVIMGDWNSSVKWDYKSRIGNHSKTVEYLRNMNIHSAYHHTRKEKQGEEKIPTFYQYRKKELPFHIDYCFVSRSILKNIRHISIGEYDEWIGYSDHCPVLVHVEDKN